MKQAFRTTISFFFLLTVLAFAAQAGNIHGTITDRTTNEPLTGATIQLSGTTLGTVADIDGKYQFNNLKSGVYTLEIRYIGYKDIIQKEIKVTHAPLILNFEMESDAQTLNDVTVVARMKRNTDVAMMTDQRRSLVVQSGVSAQQISKTQDKDASEVIKRVPGVSIIDEKFVMVRGLSQRYNNVWINGGAVPSSEADSRAFSFDIIPSSQLDNMVIVKSPAPEYPSDFTGGFILINTKDMPSENSFNLSVGAAVNDNTHFRDFYYNKGSKTDLLGFDNGLRSLQGGIDKIMNTFDGKAVDLMNNGLNNDWTVKSKKPLPDLKLNTSYSHIWDTESGRKYGLLVTLNYSNTYKTYKDMENSLFGAYDVTHDHSVYLRRSIDNQYNNDVRLGAMANLTFQPKDSRHHFEFKNIFNQLGKSRYTTREGIDAQSNNERSMEYYYSSRTTYNGQFTGKHTFDNGKLDWSTGYAYANRNMPDRRRILLNDELEKDRIGLTSGSDISREFYKLDEHIASANINYQHEYSFGTFNPTLKAGAYSEYRTREFTTRRFYYNWNQASNTLPADFRYMDMINTVLRPENYGLDKLHLFEEPNKLNDYSGNNILAAGYIGANLPLGAFNIYAGVRYEYNQMELISNTRSTAKSPQSKYYTNNDLFPSLNISYELTEKQQLRLAYGKSVNRAEFREVSSSVYYDFDLASPVEGNPDLKSAYIQNIDFRYEYYPSGGEVISVALFYKNFQNPIEWTYTVNGGTDLTYSYKNAKAANNYGIELDIRKNLGFIGLKDLSWTFNGAWIKSKVEFDKNSIELDRPMQGQSPYLINTGLFYQNEKLGLNAAVLYNRIGKRIIGVGRSVGSAGSENTNNLPNSYEMPRNTIDLSLSKKFGRWEVKAGVRDLLAEKVYFKQVSEVRKGDVKSEHEEITRAYQPGRNINLSISFNL
ncbi:MULTISPECIES: TonB-dependent receptor [Bacteroides]|uniref:TonB-dependent receptor n=1 Tax=Bacteroides TaxID=816 RepID=UPI00259CF22A|nr:MULTISPECIES: TonB-dependent receptor [Bacteroides]